MWLLSLISAITKQSDFSLISAITKQCHFTLCHYQTEWLLSHLCHHQTVPLHSLPTPNGVTSLTESVKVIISNIIPVGVLSGGNMGWGGGGGLHTCRCTLWWCCRCRGDGVNHTIVYFIILISVGVLSGSEMGGAGGWGGQGCTSLAVIYIQKRWRCGKGCVCVRSHNTCGYALWQW